MVNKKRSIKIPIIILIILLSILLCIYLYDLARYNVDNKYLKNTVEEFISLKNTSNDSVYIDNNLVIGIINIPKLDITYPIIEYINENSLNIAICKYSQTEINSEGNLCLLGHNMRNGIFFSKLHKLENDDIVELTNSSGLKLDYKVYNKYYVDPNNTEIFNQNNNYEKEVTLITCNDSSSKRLIIKLKETKE